MQKFFLGNATIIMGLLIIVGCNRSVEKDPMPPETEIPKIEGVEVEVGSNKPEPNREYNITIKDVDYELIHEKEQSIIRIKDAEIFETNTSDFYHTAEYYRQKGDEETAYIYDHQNEYEKAVQRYENIVDSLSSLPKNTQINIETHLHNFNMTPEENMEITEIRANNLLERFLNEEKLSHLSFSAKGFGDTISAYPNTNEEFRWKNNRVELILSPEK